METPKKTVETIFWGLGQDPKGFSPVKKPEKLLKWMLISTQRLAWLRDPNIDLIITWLLFPPQCETWTLAAVLTAQKLIELGGHS